MLKNRIKKIITSGLIILGLIIFHYLGWLAPIEMRLLRLSEPLLAAAYQTGTTVKIFYNSQTSNKNWQIEAIKYRDEVNRLKVESVRLSLLEEENIELRKHLKFFETKKNKFVLANIIAQGEANIINQVTVLDKGTINGVMPGLAVTNGSGQVIGKVISATPESATICIVNQNDCQFAATIQNETRTIGIVHGDLGLTMKMDFVPQSENIKNGQIVITSGLEKNISRGQVIGQVSEVNKENNALWQSAKVESLVDLNSLTIVSILIP